MASVITMPRLSPTMEEGVLAKWTKKEGDKIAPGDVIAEVETDKANMEFPLEDEGVLLKLLVKEGDTVKLGDPVAVLGEAGENPDSALAGLSQQPTRQPSVVSAQPKSEEKMPEVQAPEASGDGRVLASPLARKIATEKGVDLRLIRGSGPGGRIVKRDLEGAQPTEEARPPLSEVRQIVASAEDQLVAASQMRKTIARRLVEAKREIPHIYLTAEATVDRLLQMREELIELGNGKVSVNDLVVKALALALRRVPDANVSWTAEGIVRHGRVDVGVAVSLPEGLITPVVRAADQKSLGAISAEIKTLAERARQKKLKPEEFTNGTATVSNLGMYGIREFVAIINPPESVILAVGKTEKRPIVVEKNGPNGVSDEIVIAQRMTLTLSADHRVVDGVLGAKLLAEIVKLLEKPIGLVL
jgi:pyruvate dehydrogenase E2 component (dihydrolipoamide acetyltransferase)